MALLIQVLSVLTAVMLTVGYTYSLFLLTFAACFMQSATCLQGWIARTIATLLYLAGIGLTVLLTRWGLRVLRRRDDAKHDGFM